VYPEIDAEAIMSAHFLLAGPLLAGAILGPVAAARDGVPSSGRAPAADWVGQANQSFASFGVSIAAAGDVNGDGYGDVIVGASEFDNGQLGEGKAFVYHGSPAGLPATPDWSVEGGQVGANFGVSVGAAGDVNGDGYDDVIVGANFYDNGQTDEGRAYVYHGSASGLSPTPNWIAEGNQADAVFGYSSRTAGDVNGDGYDDVIVGAMAYDNGELDEGRAYVYLGSPKGLRRRPRWTAEGNQPGAQGGCACFGYSVGTAGDVNGDGYDDVVVGAPFQDNGQNNEGRAYVYLGSPLGPGKQAAWTGEGDQENAYFGRAVGAAGDVNGDGYDDIVVGADYYDQDQPDEGAAFVYHGSPSGPSVTAQWIGDTSLGGTRYAASVGTAGDVNGDGFGDLIVGAPTWWDTPSTGGAAFAYFGSAGGLSAEPDWMGLGQGTYVAAQYGLSVGTAGDVNGDGFDELLVGARHETNGEFFEGAAYSYHGPRP
jgi:hypothetical protein